MSGAKHSPKDPPQSDLVIRDLGRITYDDALARQRELQAEVIASRQGDTPGPMYLLLVEHEPVITVSRRAGATAHVTATADQLARAGVSVAETDRGGDVTYHGPGQLVAYPILDLNRIDLRLHGYMRFLESIVIDTLSDFGVQGYRDDRATGVWTGPRPGSKICAMGVRVSRWVTMHGLALNVHPDMDHFDLIVPCGLAGRTVTSLERVAHERRTPAPTMAEVKARLCAHFTAAVSLRDSA